MSDDVFESIKQAAKERIVSPLTGFFIFAWAAWNYPFILIVLSEHDVSLKLSEIHKLYFDFWGYLRHWVELPLASSIVAQLVIPLLNFVVMLWSHRVNAWLKTAQNAIKSPELIPIEQLERFHQKIGGQEKEIENLKFTVQQMRQQAEALEADYLKKRADLNQQVFQHKATIEKLIAKNGELKENEKSVLLIMGKSESLRINEQDLQDKLKISNSDYLLLKNRLIDLGLIQGVDAQNIGLSSAGASAVTHLKSQTGEQQSHQVEE